MIYFHTESYLFTYGQTIHPSVTVVCVLVTVDFVDELDEVVDDVVHASQVAGKD